MGGHKCYIVPPHLVQNIVQNSEGETCDQYQRCLDHENKIHAKRTDRFGFLCKPRGERRDAAIAAARAAGKPDPKNFDHPPSTKQSIVPAEILEHIAASSSVDDETRACAKQDLDHLHRLHGRVVRQQEEAGSIGGSQARDEGRGMIVGLLQSAKKSTTEKTGKTKGDGDDEDDEDPPSMSKYYRAIYDAENNMNEDDLPGKKVRIEGEDAVKDDAVNEAYDNARHVLDFYQSIFGWNSIDNKNMPVISTVHFGSKYGNAFWDPDKQQMVYGDGDNFLHNFTKCIDVIGHEMTHAVTEYTSPLDYQGQSGALNEHISDVFGIMVKQMVEDEKADKADWLIGEGCLLPSVRGVALRNMAQPGTAYNDKVLGKDPQPDNFKDYKPMYEDNGGVHIYSGIPNRAFYLASVAFGGYSWEKAGKIWWEAMNSGRIPPKATFKQFADVTIELAEEKYGDEGKKVLTDAWEKVGVKKSSS